MQSRQLLAPSEAWRHNLKTVAMDGLTGFKTTEDLPGAVAVMDSFHVVRWLLVPCMSAAGGSKGTPEDTAGRHNDPL